jgi:hypothetical protein
VRILDGFINETLFDEEQAGPVGMPMSGIGSRNPTIQGGEVRDLIGR